MKIKYKLTEKKASPFGGFHALFEMLDSIRFNELFVKSFGNIRKTRLYQPPQLLQFFMNVILSGGERITDIYRMREDPVFPELAGIASVPFDTTVRNDLRLIGNNPEAREVLLFSLNELLIKYSKARTMTIDIDGTASILHGNQAKAEKGYNAQKSQNNCLQHILVSWDEMNAPLYIETREGSMHCSNGSTEIMKKVLDRFAHQMELIVVRADSGFHATKMVELLQSYDNVKYIIKVPHNTKILDQVDDSDYNYYHYSSHEYAKAIYNMKNTIDRTYWIERNYDSKGLYLFDNCRYKYECIVTNIDNMQPHKLMELYSGRGRQEKIICELKNEFALGKITSNDFAISEAGAWVSALCCIIIAIFRNVSLRREFSKYRMKKLRFFFFNVVAYFTKHARKIVLNILSPPIGKWRYDQIIRRIHALE